MMHKRHVYIKRKKHRVHVCLFLMLLKYNPRLKCNLYFWYVYTDKNIGLQFLASGLSISHEIQRISCEIHPKPYKSKCFNQNYSVWWMQERGYDPGFHEIWGHSPLHAPPKLKSFCWNIWFYKVLGRFHLKSAEIRNVSFCVMIKYRSFFRKTNKTLPFRTFYPQVVRFATEPLFEISEESLSTTTHRVLNTWAFYRYKYIPNLLTRRYYLTESRKTQMLDPSRVTQSNLQENLAFWVVTFATLWATPPRRRVVSYPMAPG